MDVGKGEPKHAAANVHRPFATSDERRENESPAAAAAPTHCIEASRLRRPIGMMIGRYGRKRPPERPRRRSPPTNPGACTPTEPARTAEPGASPVAHASAVPTATITNAGGIPPRGRSPLKKNRSERPRV